MLSRASRRSAAVVAGMIMVLLGPGSCGQASRPAAQTPVVSHTAGTPSPPAPGATPSSTASATAPPPATLDRVLGQLVMAGMNGTWPDADLLARVRAGQVGGVILYGANVSDRLAAAVASLQHEALAGGNPPLLIATDQEGGSVRRLPGPPESPRDMTSGTTALSQGRATGALLAGEGIGVDLAPVADVDPAGSGFETRQGRGFAGGPDQVAELADSFAQGLQAEGVAATAKHFPGIGSLASDTDAAVGAVALSRSELDRRILPFRRMIADGVDVVMVANARIMAVDPGTPAVFSPAVIGRLLRGELRFQGLVMTDALDNPDLGGDAGSRAVSAVRAGADVVLLSPEADGPAAITALTAAIASGALSESRPRDAYARVLTLKRRLR